MAAEAEQPGEHPGSPVLPVQPQLGQLTLMPAVPEDWLDEAEHRDLADKVDRLAGDAEMLLTLSLHRYEGKPWAFFSTELAKYGIAVIGGWMRRGLIFRRCRDRGSGGLPALDRSFEPDEIDELTGETVAAALTHFRDDVLMKNRWKPEGGASLRTFFIGQCLMRFSNVYRRWLGNETRFRHAQTTDETETLELFTRVQVSAVDEAAVGRALADAAMVELKPRVQKAVLLTAAGRSQLEIADELGITEKAVERLLSYSRNKIKTTRRWG